MGFAASRSQDDGGGPAEVARPRWPGRAWLGEDCGKRPQCGLTCLARCCVSREANGVADAALVVGAVSYEGGVFVASGAFGSGLLSFAALLVAVDGVEIPAALGESRGAGVVLEGYVALPGLCGSFGRGAGKTADCCVGDWTTPLPAGFVDIGAGCGLTGVGEGVVNLFRWTLHV